MTAEPQNTQNTRYRWTQQDNGQWKCHDYAIFGECEIPGTEPFTKEFMLDDAMESNLEEMRGQTYRPVMLAHSDKSGNFKYDTRLAKMSQARVQEINIGKNKKWAEVVDLMDVSAETKGRMERGELAGRSVELNLKCKHTGKRRIDALSFVPKPFHRLPERSEAPRAKLKFSDLLNGNKVIHFLDELNPPPFDAKVGHKMPFNEGEGEGPPQENGKQGEGQVMAMLKQILQLLSPQQALGGAMPPPQQPMGGMPPPQMGGMPPPQQGGMPPPQLGGYDQQQSQIGMQQMSDDSKKLIKIALESLDKDNPLLHFNTAVSMPALQPQSQLSKEDIDNIGTLINNAVNPTKPEANNLQGQENPQMADNSKSTDGDAILEAHLARAKARAGAIKMSAGAGDKENILKFMQDQVGLGYNFDAKEEAACAESIGLDVWKEKILPVYGIPPLDSRPTQFDINASVPASSDTKTIEESGLFKDEAFVKKFNQSKTVKEMIKKHGREDVVRFAQESADQFNKTGSTEGTKEGYAIFQLERELPRFRG